MRSPGWFYYVQSELLVLSGQTEEAKAAAQKMVDNWDRKTPIDKYNAALGHWMTAELLSSQGKFHDARPKFAIASQALQEAAAYLPDEPYWTERYVVFLSSCADEHFRNPHLAVQLAEHVLTDTNGPLWLYLGLAQYRAGDSAGAEAALRRSVELRNGGDAVDWLLLAASQQHAGRHEKAQASFEHAQKLITSGAPIYYGYIGVLGYQRIRAEVEELF